MHSAVLVSSQKAAKLWAMGPRHDVDVRRGANKNEQTLRIDHPNTLNNNMVYRYRTVIDSIK